MTILVTGAAGFIGMHVCERLLARGDAVLGVDNLNDYYDPVLKQARLDRLIGQPGFRFARQDLAQGQDLLALFQAARPRAVVHLAAQVGVRYSLRNPAAYLDGNLMGFGHLLEACRQHPVEHLVYASSSSVYGGNERLPFSEHDSVDHPLSLYAATKKANELMAHAYSHLYRLSTTGLRFFTVYGPWGRPDMAPWLFTQAIAEGRPIDVFNEGRMLRDFTFVDDIADGVLRVLDKPATPDPAFDPASPDPATSHAPWRLFNIGNSQPVPLLEFIAAIEAALGRPAVQRRLPMQPGDVVATAADTAALEAWTGFRPATPLREGVTRFVEWFRDHHRPR